MQQPLLFFRRSKAFFSVVSRDALQRTIFICHRVENTVNTLLVAFSLIPVVSAQGNAQLPPFQPHPDNSTLTTQDVAGESGWFYFSGWDRRGQLIRSGKGNNECLGNLSLALHALGSLNQAEYSGAAGALSLLPTAGALIGIPTKELWLVHKLIPLAGVLTMCLSLGGTIIPTNAGDYNHEASLTYGGYIATTAVLERQEQETKDDDDCLTAADRFAESVRDRAENQLGGGSFSTIWIGILCQLCAVVVILIAFWYGQLGGVITWWCRSGGTHSNFYNAVNYIRREKYKCHQLSCTLFFEHTSID